MELEKIVGLIGEVQGKIDKAQGEVKHEYMKNQLGIADKNCQGAIHMIREAMRTITELEKRDDSTGGSEGNSIELENISDALEKIVAMIDENAKESKNNHLKQQLKMARSSCRGASGAIREVMRILDELAKQKDSI